MFSFFKTKKQSPSSSPESDPIPSGNNFVIVDQIQGGADPSKPQYPNQPPYPLYPNFDQHFSGYPGLPSMPPMPMNPVRPSLQHSDSIQTSNYVHDIPFKLSPQLSMGDTDEITRIQVDDILASITSKMELTQLDYDFTLERSLLQQAKSDTPDAPAEEEDHANEAEKEGDE